MDCYNLTRFLYKNRSEVHKVQGTKEWVRTYDMRETLAEQEKMKRERESGVPETETEGLEPEAGV